MPWHKQKKTIGYPIPNHSIRFFWLKKLGKSNSWLPRINDEDEVVRIQHRPEFDFWKIWEIFRGCVSMEAMGKCCVHYFGLYRNETKFLRQGLGKLEGYWITWKEYSADLSNYFPSLRIFTAILDYWGNSCFRPPDAISGNLFSIVAKKFGLPTKFETLSVAYYRAEPKD